MKKFKKLIPALCMLLVSAVILGSSTYAWFSMNNKVTATGMSVTAVANTQYLIIAQNTAGLTANDTKVEFLKDSNYGIEEDNNSKKERGNTVYPAFYNAGESAISVALSDNGTHSVAAKGWYTGFSPKFNAATDNGKLSKVIDLVDKATPAAGETGLFDYVLKYDVVIGLASGSKEASGIITVKPTFNVEATDDTTANALVAVVFFNKGEANEQILVIRQDDQASTTYETSSAIELTSTTHATVTVYLYVDGSKDAINSDSFAKADAKAVKGSLALEFTMAGIA